jgi:hypothetical protein
MMKYPAEDNDPFRDVKDWQDHRYDPGYFTGGNIHPLLKARRPNKYGYVLILSGLGFLFVAFFGRDRLWIEVVLQIAMALLLIAAGVKLVKVPNPRRPAARQGEKQ